MPVLELTIIPEKKSNLKYSQFVWTVTEFNTTNLTLHLNFTHPEIISYNNLVDYLAVTINGNYLFLDENGFSIAQCY